MKITPIVNGNLEYSCGIVGRLENTLPIRSIRFRMPDGCSLHKMSGKDCFVLVEDIIADGDRAFREGIQIDISPFAPTGHRIEAFHRCDKDEAEILFYPVK